MSEKKKPDVGLWILAAGGIVILSGIAFSIFLPMERWIELRPFYNSFIFPVFGLCEGLIGANKVVNKIAKNNALGA